MMEKPETEIPSSESNAGFQDGFSETRETKTEDPPSKPSNNRNTLLMALGGFVVVAIVVGIVMFRDKGADSSDTGKQSDTGVSEKGPVIGDRPPPPPPEPDKPKKLDQPKKPAPPPPKPDSGSSAPPKKADVPDWLTNLRAELHRCSKTNVIERVICNEKARWKYCAPDHWNKVEECKVSETPKN